MPMDTLNGPPARTDRQAVILAGGRSARFGSDKALAPIGTRSMLEHTAHALATAGFDIAISTSHATHAQCGYPVIWDSDPLRGPLYALCNICEYFPQTTVFVVACDTPFLTPTLAEWMWQQHADHAITVLASAQRASPLPGMYRTDLLPIIRTCLAHGAQSLHALLRATPQHLIIPLEQWRAIDPHGCALININTREDLYLTRDRNRF